MSSKFSKEKKGYLIQTQYRIVRLGKQRPKKEVVKINLKDLFEKSIPKTEGYGERRPIAHGQRCNEKGCPRDSKISHLVFSVSGL